MLLTLLNARINLLNTFIVPCSTFKERLRASLSLLFYIQGNLPEQLSVFLKNSTGLKHKMAQAQLTSKVDFYSRVTTMTRNLWLCMEKCISPLPPELKTNYEESLHSFCHNWLYIQRLPKVGLLISCYYYYVHFLLIYRANNQTGGMRLQRI